MIGTWVRNIVLAVVGTLFLILVGCAIGLSSGASGGTFPARTFLWTPPLLFVLLLAAVARYLSSERVASFAATLNYVVWLAILLASFLIASLVALLVAVAFSLGSPAGGPQPFLVALRVFFGVLGVSFLTLAILIRPSRISKPRKRHLWEGLVGCACLLPSFPGFLMFTFVPILASLVLSFCKWDILSGLGTIEFIGLRNYQRLLGFDFVKDAGGVLLPNDPYFWQYMGNTLYLMMGIPFGVAGSLLLAVLLNSRIRGRALFRTVYFLPSMCVPVAVFLLWKWLYHPDFGWVNWGLNLLGIKGPNWLNSMNWSKPALILTGLWIGVGGPNMIFYLAGLQAIPQELYEAAAIDGANLWQKFRFVTWPLLKPISFFIFIMSIIGGFQGNFEGAYMMTRGGPAGATTVVSYYIYNSAFRWFNMGYAAAIAWVLFLIIFVVTLINYRVGGKAVYHF